MKYTVYIPKEEKKRSILQMNNIVIIYPNLILLMFPFRTFCQKKLLLKIYSVKQISRF
jgi:hypothetical protein